MIVTVFESLYSAKPSYHHHLQVLDRIKNGGPLNGALAEIRESDKDTRQNLKKKLPIICFGGKFSERKKTALIKASGLLILDFDDGDVIKLRKQFESRPYTVAAFAGPSGKEKSLKVLIRIPEVKDDEEHKLYFGYIERLLPGLDSSGKDICRACFYTHDADCYINPNATEFTLPKGYIETMSQPEAALKSVCDGILTAPKGTSHHAVLVAAFTAGGLAAGGLINDSVALRALEDAADTRRPKEPKDSRDAIRTAFDAGKQNPLYDNESISKAVVKFDKPKRVVRGDSLIVSCDEMDDEIEDFYEDRKDFGRGIGNPDFDHFWRYRNNCFYFIISAKGQGKTTTVLFLMLMDAVKNNKKYVVGLFENTASSGRNTLISFYLDRFAKGVYQTNRDRYNHAKEKIDEHFTFINPQKAEGELYFDDILAAAKQINERDKHDALFIDPINSVPVPPDTRNEYRYMVDCARKSKDFSTSVMSLYITGHPNSSKQREGGHAKDVDAEGGGTFPNKADVTATLWRDVYGEGDAKYVTDLRVTKVRDKEIYGGDENLENFPIRFIFDKTGYGFHLACPTPHGAGYATMKKVNIKQLG